MPKPIRPSRKAATATSFAPLSAVGAPPPSISAVVANAMAGNRARSTGSIGHSCAQVIGESAGRFAVAAVAAFLDGRIGFAMIPQLVERTLAAMRAAGEVAAPGTVAEALAIHHIARDRAAALLA